ncbi:MAG: 1-acyl-sn-glycerol-3-phosphate acyltransferase, partial [Bacteroidota bacterium]
MKKMIAKILIRLFGWKTSVLISDDLKKCVMIAAPHTSNWDFFFTVLTFWKHNIKFKFFIKDDYTKSVLGPLFILMGAIGVDRSKGMNLVEFAADILKSNKEIVILVPAEGTRKRVEKWKTGFYHIAKSADVPIALGFLDFKKKLAGVGPTIHPGDNMTADFMKIQAFYKNMTG